MSTGDQAHEGQQPKPGSPGRASALQLALPPAKAAEETESIPAENNLDDEALFHKLKDRKAVVKRKPAAAGATTGKGTLPKDKSAGAESKTDGQGQEKKNKKGKGKGKGKLSKDKTKPASLKGQGKKGKQQAQGSHGRNPKRKFPLVWENGCIQKNYSSRMYKRAGTWAKNQGFSEQQVLECQREAHREAILLWKKKNRC